MIEELKKDVLKNGLSDEQAEQSKKEFGTNELARKEQESLWSMFIGAFNDLDKSIVRRPRAEDRAGSIRRDDSGACG